MQSGLEEMDVPDKIAHLFDTIRDNMDGNVIIILPDEVIKFEIVIVKLYLVTEFTTVFTITTLPETPPVTAVID